MNKFTDFFRFLGTRRDGINPAQIIGAVIILAIGAAFLKTAVNMAKRQGQQNQRQVIELEVLQNR